MQEGGLLSQKHALLKYCEAKGITNYKIFQDFNVSGAKASRPGLDAMMKEVKEGKASHVVVHSFSRFARSTRHLLEALETFKQLECCFISVVVMPHTA